MVTISAFAIKKACRGVFKVIKKELNKAMIEEDTIKLLRECDAGIKMGISSIDDVLDYVSDNTFKQYLIDCREK